MSIAFNAKLKELEERVSKLEALRPEEEITEGSLTLSKLWGEIKTIKMRMSRDGKRTFSPD